MFFRFLFYLVLIGVVYWLAKHFLAPSKERDSIPEEPSEEMIQDPICQCYVPKSQAFTVSLSGKKLFFCSSECYQKYLASKSLPK